MLYCKTEEVRVSIANQIDAIRTEQKLSRHDFAKRLGVSIHTVGEFFKGDVTLSTDSLVRMADILGARVDISITHTGVVDETCVVKTVQ